jgi:hypothetical protein
MYFKDLTPYSYSTSHIAEALNVGWLESAHTFPTGAVSPHLLTRLKHLAVEAPVRQMRGSHQCGFCAQKEIAITIAGRHRILGCAEIWVPGKEWVYAAPDLIVHYIESHAYLPPVEFLVSVGATQPDSKETEKLLKLKYPWLE